LIGHILDGQDTTIQFASIRRFLGLDGFVDITELNKGVVALHVNSDQLSKGTKKHFQIGLFGRFFVKIDDKKGLRGSYVPTAFVFLALDFSIAPGQFSTESC